MRSARYLLLLAPLLLCTALAQTPTDPTVFHLPTSAMEEVAKRTQHSKVFRLAPGNLVATSGSVDVSRMVVGYVVATGTMTSTPTPTDTPTITPTSAPTNVWTPTTNPTSPPTITPTITPTTAPTNAWTPTITPTTTPTTAPSDTPTQVPSSTATLAAPTATAVDTPSESAIDEVFGPRVTPSSLTCRTGTPRFASEEHEVPASERQPLW